MAERRWLMADPEMMMSAIDYQSFAIGPQAMCRRAGRRLD